MKAIYNTITLLAALVVLTWAGWETYLHWGVITGKAEVTRSDVAHHMRMGRHRKCCSKDCKCDTCKKTCESCCTPAPEVKEEKTPEKAK